jgi:hypothetical protein
MLPEREFGMLYRRVRSLPVEIHPAIIGADVVSRIVRD